MGQLIGAEKAGSEGKDAVCKFRCCQDQIKPD